MSKINAEKMKSAKLLKVERGPSLTRKAWITALAGVAQATCRLRAVLLGIVVISALISAVPVHASHQASHLESYASLSAFEDGHPEDAEIGIDFDCSVHPGCHALNLTNFAKLPKVDVASVVFPDQQGLLPGILAPPIPHPPNFS